MPIVDNAVILAAGTASRFTPLSFERHKALTVVRGEVLIEREIRQLKEAGIDEIYIVTGYRAEQFEYLPPHYRGVKLIYNPDYLTRNNNSSIWAARNVIKNTYICSSDNYFLKNPFEKEVDESYYAAVYADGVTNEWCITEKDGYIAFVNVGGRDSWYMLGHVFWDSAFSNRFLEILEREYDKPETRDMYWENLYIAHISELPMRIRKYSEGEIYEFDSLDDLKVFDSSYKVDTRSSILKSVAKKLDVPEAELKEIRPYKERDNLAAGFTFLCEGTYYKYSYCSGQFRKKD